MVFQLFPSHLYFSIPLLSHIFWVVYYLLTKYYLSVLCKNKNVVGASQNLIKFFPPSGLLEPLQMTNFTFLSKYTDSCLFFLLFSFNFVFFQSSQSLNSQNFNAGQEGETCRMANCNAFVFIFIDIAKWELFLQ